MTDSVYYVNTASIGGDGTGGIDVTSGSTAAFSSAQAAVDSLARVVALGDTLTVKCKGVDSGITVDGFTGDGRVYIESDESARHSGVWSDTAYTVEDSRSVTVSLRSPNVTVRWLQIRETSGGSRGCLAFDSGGDGSNVTHTLFKNNTGGSSDYGVSNKASGAEHEILHCVLYDFPTAAGDSSGDGGLLTFKKCTFVGNNKDYSSTKSNSPIFIDCAFSGSVDGISGLADGLSNYNATTNGNFGTGYTTNTNDLVNQTIDFVDASNKDYRIVSTSPLKTAGSDGGQIGAFYEESAGSGVTTDVDIELSAPLFNVIASAELPEPVSIVNVELSAPLFNVTANTELPEPIANINSSISGPLFSVESSVELPLPVVNISASVNAPLFSISTSTGLPQPIYNVSIDLLPPTFSVDASASLPAPQSSVSIGISQPTFAISATSETLTVSMDVSVDVSAPSFSVNAETTTPTFSEVSFDVGSPLFSVESSVTIPDAIANIDMAIGRPSFNVTMQISGVNIVIPKTGASITYNPGLNTLTYYVDRNSLTYDPKSNSIKY